MPTNGFSIKPLNAKLLAGEQKATEFGPSNVLTGVCMTRLSVAVCRVSQKRSLSFERATERPNPSHYPMPQFRAQGDGPFNRICSIDKLHAFPLKVAPIFIDIGLDLSVKGFPFNPQMVKLFAEGSAATKPCPVFSLRWSPALMYGAVGLFPKETLPGFPKWRHLILLVSLRKVPW